MNDSSDIERLVDSLLSLDEIKVVAYLSEAAERQSISRTSDRLIGPALIEIGERWIGGRVALSQVFMSSRICQRWIAAAVPASTATGPRIGVALFEDQHALGKELVSLALRSAGFQPVDLGVGDAASLPDRAHEAGVTVLMVSCLMLASALRMRALVDAVAALNRRLHLVVGGAPFRFDPELQHEIGARHMGQSSADAVRIARTLVDR